MNKIHFIAIGGSAMHNLAIALKNKGYQVTGSDDEIFDPAKSRLIKYGIMPENEGWFPDKITDDLEAVILGMHAKSDNPELLKAQELGLQIFSFPEYIYEQSKNKKRVVIGGSHGKTTITAMILRVLNLLKIDVDYMVGAKLEGYDVMVKLSDSANTVILEGDEYLTSPIDNRPKFHVYKPNVALISGIAWDHANVFPTFEDYINQFRIFMNLVPQNGAIIYCKDDEQVDKLLKEKSICENKIPYSLPKNEIRNGKTHILTSFGDFEISVFGNHNLLNIEGARLVCNQLGVSDENFYKSISSFKGALNRLEKVLETENTVVYKDFAHAPSKLQATLNAVKSQYSDRKLIACFELHTFTSMNQKFLSHYYKTMDNADIAVVYFSPHALELKRLPMLDTDFVKECFGRKDLQVFTDSDKLKDFLRNQDFSKSNLLLMSSGNWGGMNIKDIFEN